MPHYRNAPITEAAIEIQCRLPETITAETLQQAGINREEQYPHRGALRRAHVEMVIGAQPGTTSTSENTGWMWRSAEGKRVAQARLDGFGFSRLAAYESWEELRNEAKSFWDGYRAIATPESLTAISIKYVNQFNIPLPLRDFKDYFLTVPEVSPAMPQGLAGLFMQLQIPYIQSEIQAMLVLTQTLVPPPQAGLVSVVLAIELSRANNIPFDDEGVWQLLDRFRVIKNDVFEACITDAARELIR